MDFGTEADFGSTTSGLSSYRQVIHLPEFNEPSVDIDTWTAVGYGGHRSTNKRLRIDRIYAVLPLSDYLNGGRPCSGRAATLFLVPLVAQPIIVYSTVKRLLFTLTLLSIPLFIVGENFEVCLKDFQDGKYGHLEAGRDNHGNPVSNFTDATALTYISCVNFCGAGPEPANVLKVADTFETVQSPFPIQPPLSPPAPLRNDASLGLWSSGVLWRIALSSLFALFLQWGTTGAALIVTILTPTIGLGCRSLSFIVYAGMSTIIWFFMLVSTLLTHAATGMYKVDAHGYHQPRSRTQRLSRSTLKWTAISLRRICKLAAILNAIGIIAACFLQFTNFYNNCWCNSSVLGLEAHKAYNVIVFTHQDVVAMTQAWIGGVILGIGSATVFVCFIAAQLNSKFQVLALGFYGVYGLDVQKYCMIDYAVTTHTA